MVKSTISLALQVLRRIRAEAAKETLAAVRAVLPMEVASYLLNQKRKELARLEEDYGITIHLQGNPTARQNEFEIEFVRREATRREPPAEAPTAAKREQPAEAPAAAADNASEEAKPTVAHWCGGPPQRPGGQRWRSGAGRCPRGSAGCSGTGSARGALRHGARPRLLAPAGGVAAL
ncbi:MAG: hypothetical protein KatS3mg131_1096 [Candidatus Tectimicrobiota bacterium]|nr:MAG: hypothetical protein KatS3mg131_1096 [Candidatus Tectomicrobia bacterium]